MFPKRFRTNLWVLGVYVGRHRQEYFGTGYKARTCLPGSLCFLTQQQQEEEKIKELKPYSFRLSD